MDDLVLVLQQPIDRGLVAHRLADRFRHALAVDVEQLSVVEVGDVDDGRRASQTAQMMPSSFTWSFGRSPARTASSTPLAIAACTVPIRMLVYLPAFSP